MADSGIIKEVLNLEKVNKSQATHFALCNGDVIRYLVDLNGGKKRLSGNISTYSGKLGLLMKIINILPLSALKAGKLGYFVKVSLENSVEGQRKKTGTKAWNVIVGTYDEKQKLVLQCFNKTGEAAFIKIGNKATDKEMVAEIKFLAEERKYQNFDIPVMIDYCLRNDRRRFNIQVTKEFHGDKVEPVLNSEIVEIYKELSQNRKDSLELSHGDFAPWNLKICDGRYTLFDWEHCAYRIPGSDLMHYAAIIEVVLNGKSYSEAYDIGLQNIREYMPEFEIDKALFIKEFEKLRTQIA